MVLLFERFYTGFVCIYHTLLFVLCFPAIVAPLDPAALLCLEHITFGGFC